MASTTSTATTRASIPLEDMMIEPASANHSQSHLNLRDDSVGPREAFDSYPDGGLLPWTQVLAVFLLFFTTIGALYSWGVFQAELVKQGRKVALAGSFLAGLGPLLAGSCTHSVAGLVITEGLIFGTGQCLVFFAGATLPSSYFLRKRGLATGLVYAGGGIGGAVFAVVCARLIEEVGLPWTFRATGLIFTAINIPAALLLETRLPKEPLFPKGMIVDWALFKDPRFALVTAATALALFPLFVTAYFLPLYAASIGLSASTGAWLLAGFNLASALGRVGG
ncbi:hypothetical protein RQP46_006559 [Phenoliferia psychrophenolica]